MRPLLPLVALAALAATAHAAEPVFQKGCTFAGWYRGAYGSPQALRALEALVETGAEWISVVVAVYQADLQATELYRHPRRTVSDDELRTIIRVARQRGLHVMLKPQVDLDGPGDRTEIAPVEAHWPTWFRSYRTLMGEYASLAQDEGVEVFCVGVELDSTRHRQADWRRVISAVRELYSGPLTYAANWSRETDIKWWDALDYIGIDAYYPVATGPGPTIAELKAGWAPHLERLRELHAREQRPIIFTEIGYRSIAGAGVRPWEWRQPGALSLEEQADLYQAALEVLWDEPWFYGAYWWQWQTPLPRDPLTDTTFHLWRKPAQAILRDFYSRPAPRGL